MVRAVGPGRRLARDTQLSCHAHRGKLISDLGTPRRSCLVNELWQRHRTACARGDEKASPWRRRSPYLPPAPCTSQLSTHGGGGAHLFLRCPGPQPRTPPASAHTTCPHAASQGRPGPRFRQRIRKRSSGSWSISRRGKGIGKKFPQWEPKRLAGLDILSMRGAHLNLYVRIHAIPI
jgi:hypothetical protein